MRCRRTDVCKTCRALRSKPWLYAKPDMTGVTRMKPVEKWHELTEREIEMAHIKTPEQVAREARSGMRGGVV